MTNINTNFASTQSQTSQTSQTSRNQNTENNSFSTELLQALIAAQEAQTQAAQSAQTQSAQTTTYENSYYSFENAGANDSIDSFTELKLTDVSVNKTKNGKFTTVIDWSAYDKILSDSQIAGLSRQYGGELTLVQFAEAMQAISRLAKAKDEEDEVLEEMSENIVDGNDTVDNEVVTMQSKYSQDFMDSLNFYDINKNTDFFNSDANLFDEFKLLLENENYDYVNFFSLLGEKNNDKFNLAIKDVDSTEIMENKVSFEDDSPLNLNKYGGFSHLTPLIVQNIKDEINSISE